MNKQNRIIFFSLIIVFFSFCIPLQAIPDSTHTVISGNIKNLNVYPKTKFFTLKIIDFRGKETVLKDSIKKDGTFKFVFDLYITQDISIEPIVGKFIAHPGDNIQLGIDFKNIGYVRFSGDGQKTNQELYKYLNSNYLAVSYNDQKIPILLPEAYKIYCDSVKNQMVKQRQRFIKEVNPSSEVLKWTNDYVKINYFKALLNFPVSINIELMKENKQLVPSSDYYTFLDHVGSVFTTTLLNTDAYELLNGYTFNICLRNLMDITSNKDSFNLVFMNYIIKNQQNTLFKQALIGNFFYQKLNQKDLNFFVTYKSLFDENTQEPFIKKTIDIYYQSLLEDLENPQKATNTIFKRMTNLSGKYLLDSIVTAHKGKVLYLDFWVRGHKYCQDDFTFMKKLMQDTMGKNIEFVYICLDSNIVEGELELMWYQVQGSHVYCNDEQSMSFDKGFDISAIPYYVLINKQGQIAECGNQLGPSNSETIRKIDKLVSEN